MKTEFAPLFKLGRAERLQLVEDLWDSIAQEGAQLPVPDGSATGCAAAKSDFCSILPRAARGSKLSSGLAASMIERVILSPASRSPKLGDGLAPRTPIAFAKKRGCRVAQINAQNV